MGNNFNKFEVTQTDTLLAKFYGLPKIYKLTSPLCPIISVISTPIYMISKILNEILSSCIEPPISKVKNEFIKLINGIYIDENHIFISLDVTSLYTNTLNWLSKVSIAIE